MQNNLKSKIKKNQEVSVALDLLASTLMNEQNRIYEIGAKAMLAQDNKMAQEVINFSYKLKPILTKVQDIIVEWDNLIKDKDQASEKVKKIVEGDGSLFGKKVRKSTKGFTRNILKPIASQTNLIVKFPDGTTISNHNASETFVKTIEYIGEDKVHKLGLTSCQEELVSSSQSKKYPGNSHKSKLDYYILTHSNTSDKIKYLENISNALNLNLKITSKVKKDKEVVPKKQNSTTKKQNSDYNKLKNECPIFYLKKAKQIIAHGRLTSDGFLLLAGAQLQNITKSAPNWVIKNRKDFLDEKKSTDLVTIEDILFDSPSTPASYVLGSSINGKITWKTADGITLKEFEEKQDK